MNGAVECGRHGRQRQAFACGHVLESLRARTPRGFHWCRDADGEFNGWCDVCDARLEEAGGAWTAEIEAEADIQLLCEQCIRDVMRLNGVRENEQ